MFGQKALLREVQMRWFHVYITISILYKVVNTVYLFSDGYAGQNKNSTVMQYLYTLVKSGRFSRIQHIFPIRGHSFLPCDRDFAKTESKKKKVERLYIPEHWMEVIRKTRKVKPFSVVPVTQSLVLDFKNHLTPFFKKTYTSLTKETLRFREARMFEYARDHPTEVWVKYSLSVDDEWHRFSIEKRRSSGPTLPTQPVTTDIVPLNPKKVDDLKSSLQVCP